MEHGDSLEIRSMELVYGDCIDIMDQYPSGCFDMCFTDPPYLMKYKSNYRSKSADSSSKEKMKQKEIRGDTLETGKRMIEKFYQRLYRVLSRDTFAFVCFKPDGRDKKGDYVDLGRIFKEYAIKAGFDIRNTIIWAKNNWSAGDLEGALGFQCEHILMMVKGNPKLRSNTRYTDLWPFDRVPDGERIHPNQKPVALIQRAIEIGLDLDAEGNEACIIDPFAGSGSTGVAAHAMGIESVLIEKDEERFTELSVYVDEQTMPGLW